MTIANNGYTCIVITRTSITFLKFTFYMLEFLMISMSPIINNINVNFKIYAINYKEMG